MGALDNMLAGKRQERTTTGALDRMIEASKQEQTGTQTAPRSVAAMRKSAEYRPLKTAEEAVRATTEDTSGSGGKPRRTGADRDDETDEVRSGGGA